MMLLFAEYCDTFFGRINHQYELTDLMGRGTDCPSYQNKGKWMSFIVAMLFVCGVVIITVELEYSGRM